MHCLRLHHTEEVGRFRLPKSDLSKMDVRKEVGLGTETAL